MMNTVQEEAIERGGSMMHLAVAGGERALITEFDGR